MIFNGFFERIHSELQRPKESTSARYFFVCLKLVSIEVSHRRDLALTDQMTTSNYQITSIIVIIFYLVTIVNIERDFTYLIPLIKML